MINWAEAPKHEEYETVWIVDNTGHYESKWHYHDLNANTYQEFDSSRWYSTREWEYDYTVFRREDTIPSCKNDKEHDPDNYCEHCSTCHDCIAESRLEETTALLSIKKEAKELRSVLKTALTLLEVCKERGLYDSLGHIILYLQEELEKERS